MWAAGTILTSLVMTSGYMFTRIRGAPYTGGNGQWIAPGYQNQYGQETQVVAMICKDIFNRNETRLTILHCTDGLLAVSFLMLIVIIPYQSSSVRQRAQVYLWTAVIMIIYSILVSLFRVKNRGTPFKFSCERYMLTVFTGYPFKLFL